jgi:protocatechuate 3,4-dioxygenase beta subunit
VSLAAQAVTGTILGAVTDTTGAVMPGVTVTLTNAGTGLVRVVVTDSNGEYTAPSLPTGRYIVKAELPGFKTVNVPDADLGVDQHSAHQRPARGRRGRGIGDRSRARRRSSRPPRPSWARP